MKYLPSRLVLAFWLGCLPTEARKWQDVVDRSIYTMPNLDMDRHQLKVELNPFYVPGEQEDEGPTPAPVLEAWVTISPAPTDSPSAIPSDAPSLAPTGPTSSPTMRIENVDGNGGCTNETILYRVNMYDSWGDGWHPSTKVTITGIEDQDTRVISGNTVTKTHTTQHGDTTVTITSTVELTSDHPFGTAPVDEPYNYVNPLGKIFEGNLHRGSAGYAYVCLMPSRCYEVLAHGGDYLEEVSWSIEPVHLGSPDGVAQSVVQGGAPSDCSFSIPDANGESFCQASCSSTLHPEHTQVPDVVEQMVPMEPYDPSAASHEQSSARMGENLLKAIRNGNN